MRKFLRAAATAVALAAAGMSLGGCKTADEILHTVQAAAGFAVSQDQVDAFRSTYVGFLSWASDYAKTPRCKAGQNYFLNGCHEPSTLKRLQGIKNDVSSGLDQVQHMVDAGDNKGAVALFNTVRAALSTGQGIVSTLTAPK